MDPGPLYNVTTFQPNPLYNVTTFQPSPLYNVTTVLQQDNSSVNCIISDGSLKIILPIFYSIICVAGLLTNTLAIYVFTCIQHKWNSIRVYLLNVAVADLLLIICLPFRIMYHSMDNTWVLGQPFCKTVGTLFYMNMYVSIVLLGFISVDRYIKITQTLRQYKVLKTKFSIFVCCLLWAISIISTIPVISVKEGNETNTSNMCLHYKDKKKVKWKAFLNFGVVGLFWVVFIFLVFSYIKIANNLFKISKEKSSFPNAGKYNSTARKSFIVLFIFTICFVPYHTFRFFYIISQLHDPSCYWKNVINKTNEIMLLFSALNSCLDPVMYFLLSSTIRKTVFKIICIKVPKDVSITDSTTEIKRKYSAQGTLSAIVDLNNISPSKTNELFNNVKYERCGTPDSN